MIMMKFVTYYRWENNGGKKKWWNSHEFGFRKTDGLTSKSNQCEFSLPVNYGRVLGSLDRLVFEDSYLLLEQLYLSMDQFRQHIPLYSPSNYLKWFPNMSAKNERKFDSQKPLQRSF